MLYERRPEIVGIGPPAVLHQLVPEAEQQIEAMYRAYSDQLAVVMRQVGRNELSLARLRQFNQELEGILSDIRSGTRERDRYRRSGEPKRIAEQTKLARYRMAIACAFERAGLLLSGFDRLVGRRRRLGDDRAARHELDEPRFEGAPQ